MIGINVAVDGMITSLVMVGTPPHQLAGSVQAVLVPPIQYPVGFTVTFTVEADDVPPQPVAVTETTAVPE
jgi:hypothetical protein